MMAGITNRIDRSLANARPRGKPTPGTSRDLWQVNSYDRFSWCSSFGYRPFAKDPAQMPSQPACLALLVKQAISVLIRARPH